MSQSLRIERLNSDTEIVLKPSTLYLVKGATAGRLKIFVSDSLGENLLEASNDEDIFSSYITLNATAPALPHSRQLWWNTTNGVLYVQYDDGASIHWVEAINSVKVPEFSGNGAANTMSRSDHWHEGVVLSKSDW
jgi:hypothetical protein